MSHSRRSYRRGAFISSSRENKANKGKFYCSLCKLDYSTEQDLSEHCWSMLHHRRLAKDLGVNYIHKCSLCSKESTGLLEYCKHIHGDNHRQELRLWKESQRKPSRKDQRGGATSGSRTSANSRKTMVEVIDVPEEPSNEGVPGNTSSTCTHDKSVSPALVTVNNGFNHEAGNDGPPETGSSTNAKGSFESTSVGPIRFNIFPLRKPGCIGNSRRSSEPLPTSGTSSTPIDNNASSAPCSTPPLLPPDTIDEQAVPEKDDSSTVDRHGQELRTTEPSTISSLVCSTTGTDVAHLLDCAVLPAVARSSTVAQSTAVQGKDKQTSEMQVPIKQEIIDSDNENGSIGTDDVDDPNYKPCSFRKTDSVQCNVLTDKRFCPYHLSVLAAVKSHITSVAAKSPAEASGVIALLSSDTLQTSSAPSTSQCEEPLISIYKRTNPNPATHSSDDDVSFSMSLSRARACSTSAQGSTVTSLIKETMATKPDSAAVTVSANTSRSVDTLAAGHKSPREPLPLIDLRETGILRSSGNGAGPPIESSTCVTSSPSLISMAQTTRPSTGPPMQMSTMVSQTLPSHAVIPESHKGSGVSSNTRTDVGVFFRNLLSHSHSQSQTSQVSTVYSPSHEKSRSYCIPDVSLASPHNSMHNRSHDMPSVHDEQLRPVIDLNKKSTAAVAVTELQKQGMANMPGKRKRSANSSNMGAVQKKPRLGEGLEKLLNLEKEEDAKLQELNKISSSVSEIRHKMQLLYMDLDVLIAREIKASKELWIVRKRRKTILSNARCGRISIFPIADVRQEPAESIEMFTRATDGYMPSGMDVPTHDLVSDAGTPDIAEVSKTKPLPKNSRVEDMKKRIENLKQIVEHGKGKGNFPKSKISQHKKPYKSERWRRKKGKNKREAAAQDPKSNVPHREKTPQSNCLPVQIPNLSSSANPMNDEQVSDRPSQKQPPSQNAAAGNNSNTVIAESFSGHTAPVTGLLIDGAYLCSCAADKKIGLFNVYSGKGLLFNSGHKQAISSMEVYSEKSMTRLCTGSNDRTVRIHCPLKLRCLRKFVFSARVLALHAAFGILYVALADGHVSLISLQKSVFLRKIQCHSAVPCAVSCLTSGTFDGQDVFCTGSFDTTITCRSSQDGRLCHVISDHQSKILCIKVHGGSIFSGSADSIVLMHCLKTGDMLRRFGSHMHGITGLHICGRFLVTSSLDKLIRCFLIEDSSLVQVYGGHSSMIFCLCIFRAAKIFSGSQDGEICTADLDFSTQHICEWKDCALPFARVDHLKQHLLEFHYSSRFPVFCKWEGCRHRFMGKPTDRDIVQHLDDHLKHTSTPIQSAGQSSSPSEQPTSRRRRRSATDYREQQRDAT